MFLTLAHQFVSELSNGSPWSFNGAALSRSEVARTCYKGTLLVCGNSFEATEFQYFDVPIRLFFLRQTLSVAFGQRHHSLNLCWNSRKRKRGLLLPVGAVKSCCSGMPLFFRRGVGMR